MSWNNGQMFTSSFPPFNAQMNAKENKENINTFQSGNSKKSLPMQTPFKERSTNTNQAHSTNYFGAQQPNVTKSHSNTNPPPTPKPV